MSDKSISELALDVLKRNVGSVLSPHVIARRISYREDYAREIKAETVRRHLDRLTQDGVVPLIWGASVYLERVGSQRYRAVHSSDVPIGKCTDSMLVGELHRRLLNSKL